MIRSEADLAAYYAAHPGLRPPQGSAPQVLPTFPATPPAPAHPCAPYRSRTEQRFAARLTQEQRDGQVLDWWYEPLKLRLGEKCYYTADFLVRYTDHPGDFYLWEVKGGWARDDAIVKTKTAAKLYPCFHFVWAQWRDGAWHERLIRGA